MVSIGRRRKSKTSSIPVVPRIGLVYLYRKAEGQWPARRFVASYRAFPPGVEHEFITVYKGFASNELQSENPIFKGVERRHVLVDDAMTDINAYLIAARSFPNIDVFCFLNTFTEIATTNWLLHLSNAVSNPHVGIAGATGSYESLLNSLQLNAKATWLCRTNFLQFQWSLFHQYRARMLRTAPVWLVKQLIKILLRGFHKPADDYDYLLRHEAAFDVYWKSVTRPGKTLGWLPGGYPPFPNPHIRTNGFIIRRSRLLPFIRKSRRMTKPASYLFESGKEGLTRQLLKNGLKAVVVNNRGAVFDVADWPKSQTFRLGQQQGLLIRDNQTRGFDILRQGEKDVLAYMTWGSSLKYTPGQVFTFGIPFDVK